MNETSLLPDLWLDSIYWREPLWLLLALQPFILLLIRQLSSKRKLACYADPNLQAWVNWQQTENSRTWISWICSRQTSYIIAWLLLAVSLAGPRLLLEQAATADEPDMNIMLVVDVSRSMQARDIAPSRLRRVQIEIYELLQRAPNNRVGLILYTSRAHLLVPFTRDANALKYYLKLMDSIPLPTSGSSPVGALELARKEIELAGFQNKSAILWFTDGDFIDGDFTNSDLANNKSDAVKKLVATVKSLSSLSIPLYILGMGSPEGEAVPLTDGGWLQHQGRPVISRMNETILSGLAQAGDGDFIIAQDDDSDWHRLYNKGMAANTQLAERALSDDKVVWQELYPWTLLPAIMLLFTSLMPYRLRLLKSGQSLFLACLLLTLLPSLHPSNAAQAAERTPPGTIETENKAYQYFTAGNFTLAAEFYRQLPGYNGRFGEGNSYYRMQEYTQAIAQYNQAVLLADSDQQRGSAIYNLANATFKSGDYAAAAALFRDALLYQPSHVASRTNLALSDSLQQLVEEQIQQGTANRMGSGPRSTRAQQGLDINASGSISFDNEEERKKADIALPDLPAEELENLIARGLAHVKLANEKQENMARNRQQKHVQWQQDITAARLRMRELEDRQRLLWKRLFEMEEGFAAPVEEAETVPGVLPW